MKFFSKTLLSLVCFSLILAPLSADYSFSVIGIPHFDDENQTKSEELKEPENNVATPTVEKTKPIKKLKPKTEPKQIEELTPIPEQKEIKKRKRRLEPNRHKAYRTPHVQNKSPYISELDEIYQVGLNISQFLDLDNFEALPRYHSGNKKADEKINITKKAVQYFNDKGLSDPKEICAVSKKYFQDLSKKAYENGKYKLAYDYFTTAMEGEKYSNKELDDCKKHIERKKNEFKHGDIFLFGKYEQDGNLENGSEPIEWIVLRDTGKELILMSKYVLAHKPMHSYDEMFLWENSTLCSWLNNEFYNAAFNEKEKKQMRKVGADWYEEDYDGDYVVIPVSNDLDDLVDNFWLRAYSIPSNETAQDFIDYEGKPFLLPKDENGKAKRDKWYMYSQYWTRKQPFVLSSNENINKFSNFVYMPSGYWINQYNGQTNHRDDSCEVEYTFCDENGFLHVTKTKYSNGVRPVISVAYGNVEKPEVSKNSSIDLNKGFTRSEINEIYQVGLNIFKFMDFDGFDNLPHFNKGEKKARKKRNIIKTAVKYFTKNGLTDPEAIHSISKKYFQDLAQNAYKTGDYKQAYHYFTTIIEGEKDNNQELMDCKKYIANNKSKLKYGDIVFFGKYEQDGNLENGPEPIEWIVLKKSDGKLILLSKYVLTHRPIHSVEGQFKWYESELCAWLNNEFYNSAFNDAEKKQMCKVGNNIWYMKEYEGDYVVIPGSDDLKDLDNFWLMTCAVPSDKIAKSLITYDWKPFVTTKTKKGNISYEPESGFDFYEDGMKKQLSVLTMNPNISEDSELVYWPSGYWENQNNGSSFDGEFYCYKDENGIGWGGLDARTCNGIRPLIGIAYPYSE